MSELPQDATRAIVERLGDTALHSPDGRVRILPDSPMEWWIPAAYARLGAKRDSMTPAEVAAVQAFLGPLE